MTSTLLNLSLLNGQLKAVAYNRGKISGQWESPEAVADFTGFSPVLKQIVEKTGFTGNQVNLVLAHPRLTQQLIETPPVKGWKLREFLDRRVKQVKPFTAEAAWSYEPTLPTKNAQSVLLHLAAKPLLDQLERSCEVLGLRLNMVIPATTVLKRQLSQLPVADDEIALLAAETGSGTTVVVGRRNGQLYLGRSLSSSWKVSPERVNTDLNRTLLYVKQQFGVTVNSIWLFGQGADAQTSVLQAALGMPVRVSPVAPVPCHWNNEAAQMPADTPGNLITAEQQKAPQRRVMGRVTAGMILFLLLVALAVTASVQVLASDRLKQLKRIGDKLEQLQVRKSNLEQRETELQRKKEYVRTVSDDRVPAVGGLFLGHLGYVMPPDLLLTNLNLKLQQDVWQVQLAGTRQPILDTNEVEVLDDPIGALRDRLVQGPFHLDLAKGGSAENSISEADSRMDSAAAPAPESKSEFSFEGRMR